MTSVHMQGILSGRPEGSLRRTSGLLSCIQPGFQSVCRGICPKLQPNQAARHLPTNCSPAQAVRLEDAPARSWAAKMATAQSGCSLDEFRWSNVRNGHRQAHGGVALISTRCVFLCVHDLASDIMMLQGGEEKKKKQ